ncbi:MULTISPECIES: LysR family transcriptional regulator [unclassified Variovorax]|uniref:LysR family transcriptional regulator n=1 Tax=unclassified Variovorax TaxID=663243 RepID=UPI00083997AB|nr:MULTISPECIES: LysR family transcriptional regulator [unclassified Variovorax]PNG56227.1 HTH-type transcriptional regulator GltC [Variovorax sp. B4]PNG57651.1 HTH-type transcriptional regulator GltC [Variovorax sp. B2]VTV09930.1 HTH-type transcriptional regulator GltC [Variovorax sp. WDL1]
MSRDPGLHLKNPTSLRYFYEVAQAGSFRRAAERTHVAASAINRQVKNLEAEIGAVLFERGRGRSGLKLTSAGEVFIHHLKRAMGEIATARTEVDALRGLQRGTVNFGVNEGFSRELLPQLLAAFHKRYPGVNYEVTVASSPRLVELALDDEIDFALGYNPPAHAGLSILAKRDVGSCVMVPRKHPLAERSWVRLTECAAYDLVMPDASLALRATLDQMFARVGMKPRAVLTTNSYELMRSAASAGVGVAILTQYLFGRDPNHPDAAFVPIRDSRIKPQVLVCCTRAGRHLSVASLSLIEEIRNALRHKL